MFKVVRLAMFLLISGNLYAAPQTTNWGKITLYAVGWSADQVRVQTAATFLNDGCSTTDGYITDPSDPGNRAYQSALLAAFAASKDVQLVIDGCYSTRPKIIGVYVR